MKYELDLGRAVKLPNLGVISIQNYKDDSIIYFKFDENFLTDCGLIYEEVSDRLKQIDLKEVRFPTIGLNFVNIKKFTAIERDIMIQAIQNILIEVENIFQTFDNFQIDLGVLGKFLVEDKNLRFLPYIRNKKKVVQSKITIKNMIDLNLKRFPQSTIGKSMENGSQLSNQAEPINSSEVKRQLTVKDQEMIEMSQKSMARSIFSQHEAAFVSPLRRGTKPIEEDMLMNEMFGAGTDPKALNQNFSKLAEDANYLMQASFTKPPYARIRCPPVIDYFCRTLSAPVASQYNSLSASSRIGLFYSNATKYLYFDQDTKGIAYLKVKENRTKLTANEELLQAMATQEEEIKYIINKVLHKDLLPKIEAKENCYSRYQQYIQSEIPREIIAPIRQYWITSILDLIPANYKDLEQSTMERIIDGVLNEINEDYYFTIKKSILDYVLKEDSEKLRIGILQRFDEPLEYGEALPRGVIIDEDWVGRMKVNDGELKTNLVNYNKATLSIINTWSNIGKESYFVLQKHDSQKESLTDFVLRQKKQIGKILKTLKENWIPSVSEIYKNELGDMSKKEIFKFFVSTKILMSSQLRDLIYKSLEELKTFFLKFHKEQYLEAPQCIENDLDRTKYLQKSFLVIKLKEEDKKVRLSEKIETIRNEIVKLIDEVVMTSHNIPLPQNNFTRSNQKALFSISPKTDEVVVEIREIVDTVLYENLGIIDKVTEVFAPYEYLLNEAEGLTEKLKKKLELREYQDLINKYRDISEEIDTQVPNDIYMNLAQIDCREIKETLCKKCDDYVKKIREVVDKNLNNLKQKIGDDQKSMFDIFHQMKSNNTDAQHYEECEKQRELIERTERVKCMNSFKEAVSWLMFLYQNKEFIHSDHITSMYATAESVHKIDDRLKDVRDKNNSMKDAIKNDLDRKKLDFDSKMKSLITEISDLRTYGGFFDFGTKEEKVRILEETVAERKADAEKINSIQEKIGSRRMNFEELNNAEKNLLPYRDLWVLANKWDKTEYEKVIIFSLVPDEVIKDTRKKNGEVAGIITTFEEMEERPKEPLDAAHKLKDLIVKFLEVAPLLQALCARGMQDRHWVDVSRISEMEWNAHASWTLKDCIDNGMIAHKTKLLEIADRANKEYSNFSLLEEMASEWTSVELSVKLWKETQTYALIGDSVDDLRTLLDDHIIKTQTMKGSQFARVFEERIKNWEDSLLYIRNTLEIWVKVQANWIYLQPIFNSPDIRKELMAESEMFNRIDKKWRDVMAHILANNKAIKIADDPSLLDTLTDMLTKLEGIQNELSGYLNTKRTKFPRFYFLSADSLIEVLSDAKDPKKIQKFAKILFEGVQTFTFDSSDVVLGVKSSEGEVIAFQEVIDTKPHAGLVEIWLQMFEDLMVQEVRLFIENAFKQFEEISREECKPS
jgi:dynein heavy chain